MAITVRRAIIIAAGAAVIASAPALAQVDRNIVLNILIECSKIDDAMARVACYDNNIRSVAGTVANGVPRESKNPQGGSAPAATGGVAGIGRESARSPQRPPAPTGEFARITPTVTDVVERGPGAYLLTLEDGAQWEFAEDMALSYRAPRRGSTVEIERGLLGSYRMRFDGQQPVRVRRVR